MAAVSGNFFAAQHKRLLRDGAGEINLGVVAGGIMISDEDKI